MPLVGSQSLDRLLGTWRLVADLSANRRFPVGEGEFHPKFSISPVGEIHLIPIQLYRIIGAINIRDIIERSS